MLSQGTWRLTMWPQEQLIDLCQTGHATVAMWGCQRELLA